MEELKGNLNRIQVQLKATIQSHQMLVAKLKKEPKNVEVQTELRQVQSEISRLNDQQKNIVMKLRNLSPQKQSSPKLTNDAPKCKSLLAKSHAMTSVANSNQSSPRTPQRPSIMQGTSRQRGYVLRVHNDMPVVPVKTPTESKDIRGLLCSTVEAKNLSPEQLQKVQYMASLNLVTRDRLTEIQSKRSERKRRSTATPQFSYVHGHLQPERKRSSVCDEGLVTEKRRGRPPSVATITEVRPQPAMISKEETCAVCRRAGQLFSCDTCNRLYHYTCLSMATRPPAQWSCPKCQPPENKSSIITTTATMVSSSSSSSQKASLQSTTNNDTGGGSGPQHHTGMSSQRAELQRKYRDLLEQQNQLKSSAKQLSQDVLKKAKEKSKLLRENEIAEEDLNKLKEIIKSLQK